MEVKEFSDRLLNETEKVIIGKSECIRKVIMALLAGGNVLFSDLPGCGKTTLSKAISLAAGLDFTRIQFVSDLLPSDIIGMKIYNQKSGEFELRKGPIMTNILLADEINRAIPRTQSALLEAMEEQQITIDGERFELPHPFIVLATQNPVESESTFALPVAQMDRFLISLSIGYPEPSDEAEMLRRVGIKTPFEKINAITDAEELSELQKKCQMVHTSEAIENYIVALVNATRCDHRLKAGGSPRASRSLFQASKVWALMNGRDYVTPSDVQDIIYDVLSHRLLLTSTSHYSGVTVKAVIDDILSSTDIKELSSIDYEK